MASMPGWARNTCTTNHHPFIDPSTTRLLDSWFAESQVRPIIRGITMPISNSGTRLLIPAVLLIGLFGCKKDLDLRQNQANKNVAHSSIIVAEYISIRSIERVKGDQKTIVFNGYLGNGDQLKIDPGQYILSTKIEFSETQSTRANTNISLDIRSSRVDHWLITVEPGNTYEIFNVVTPPSKWAPGIRPVSSSSSVR